MPAQLHNGGQLAALVPRAADGFGGHFINDEHAEVLDLHSPACNLQQPFLASLQPLDG